MVPACGGDDVGGGFAEELGEGSAGPVEVFVGIKREDPFGVEVGGCHVG